MRLIYTAKAEKDGVGIAGQTVTDEKQDRAFLIVHGYVYETDESAPVSVKSDITAPVERGDVRPPKKAGR